MTDNPCPMVGISVLVVRGSCALLSRRRGAHGAGQYGTPGGHLENGESYEEATLRELAEECGPNLLVTPPRFLCVTNLREYLPKHYTDIGMVVHWQSGVPQLMEPDKAIGWAWFHLDDLPVPRFGTVDNLAISYQTNQPYFAD